MSRKSSDKRPIVIRREEVVEGGHHGGAWKVAYADFVTAMMAFFLLMWLLNATSDDQRRGIADYFSPMNPLAHATSGTGLPFGGKTPFEEGSYISNLGTVSIMPGHSTAPSTPENPVDPAPQQVHGAAATEPDSISEGQKSFDPAGRTDKDPERRATKLPGAGLSDSAARVSPDARALALVGIKTQQAQAVTARAEAQAEELRARLEAAERASMTAAADQLRAAISGDKLLTDLSHQVTIDITPEGLRIQLLDEDRRPMFASGASVMQDRARQLLLKVAAVLKGMNEPISIAGHTDSTPYRGTDKTNWELSTERANATRRLLVEAGLPEQRFRSVTGNADRDPLLPNDPSAAANRRIAIVVLRAVPAAHAAATPAPTAPAAGQPAR
jgi:chemotaxis protein MotB